MTQPDLVPLKEKMSIRTTPQSESSFPYQLFSILEKDEYNDIITWDAEGARIEIKNRESLVKTVLPLFFTHTKLASFLRQLNFYGFKSHREIRGTRLYFHPLFQRGNRALLSKMVRNKPLRSEAQSDPQTNSPSSPQNSSCDLGRATELMRELRFAYLSIEELREENQDLRYQIKKNALFNPGNIPHRKSEAFRKNQDRFNSFQPSELDNRAPFFESSFPFKSNDKPNPSFADGEEEDAQIESLSLTPYLQVSSLNFNSGDYAQNYCKSKNMPFFDEDN